MPETHGRRRDDQSAAARRSHGLRALPRQYINRVTSGRRVLTTQGTLGVDGKYRTLVVRQPAALTAAAALWPSASRQASGRKPTAALSPGPRHSTPCLTGHNSRTIISATRRPVVVQLDSTGRRYCVALYRATAVGPIRARPRERRRHRLP